MKQLVEIYIKLAELETKKEVSTQSYFRFYIVSLFIALVYALIIRTETFLQIFLNRKLIGEYRYPEKSVIFVSLNL